MADNIQRSEPQSDDQYSESTISQASNNWRVRLSVSCSGCECQPALIYAPSASGIVSWNPVSGEQCGLVPQSAFLVTACLKSTNTTASSLHTDIFLVVIAASKSTQEQTFSGSKQHPKQDLDINQNWADMDNEREQTRQSQTVHGRVLPRA